MIICLYIKTHHVKNRHGMVVKYLGQTSKDPHKYPGSGKHWMLHWKKHGKWAADTEIVGEFELPREKDLLEETALALSAKLNIVDSDEWANLRPENGLDGAVPGGTLSQDHIDKISKAGMGNQHAKGFKHTQETRDKVSAAGMGNTYSLGYKHTDETKANMKAAHSPLSGAKKGVKHTAEHNTKISAALMGNTYALGHEHTDEAKAKMSAAGMGNSKAKGYKFTDEQRAHQTKMLMGNTYATTKLSDDDVRAIRKSTKTNKELGVQFGMSTKYIWAIKTGLSRKNVK